MVKNKPLIVKILVSTLIVAIIVGIFFIKNTQNSPSVIDSDNQTDKTFSLKITSVDLEEIKQYGVPTVIDFGSDSCIPCKQMAPVLKTLNNEWQGKAAVQFMDVWEYTEGVDKFPIQVIPTQVFFNADGTPFVPSDILQKCSLICIQTKQAMNIFLLFIKEESQKKKCDKFLQRWELSRYD